ncbi:hypothetical protein FD755_008743 [Muntiacus reevesi]|uniref:Uncharacterized protein n=1 Tax=Muntiacus reevesi TaxID=9886 RepID=A0A5J5MLI1_MUNRE|nr:hypothetical protein FD755_008743 [Muntiacus reevesi]
MSHGGSWRQENNVMCYPRWCEQSFKPMEKTRPK